MKGLEKVEKDLKGVDAQARKLQRSLTKTGKKIEGVGSKLTKNITLPLLAAGGAVVKFGADFEDAMTKSLAITSGVSDKMRKKMEKTAMEVSEITTSSATEAAEGYFFLASAGLDAAQSIGALPRVAKFAQAGAFGLSKATDLLTDAQSALGLSSKDTEKGLAGLVRVSDVLVKANTLSNASVQQFAESLTNKAAGALRLLGKEVEEGAAVLAVFADKGHKGAAAGESLNIVLRDLQTASIKNKKAFKDAGIAVFDSAGEMRNLADIVEDVEGRLAGMSDEQRKVELGMLGFQDESVAVISSLLGSSKAIRGYEKDLRNAGGTTDRVAKNQLKSLSAQTKILRNRLQNAAITLSSSLIPLIKDKFLPVVEDWIGKLKKVVDWFTALPKGVKDTVAGLIVFVAMAGPALMLVGKFVGAFKTLVPLLMLAKKGLILLSAVMSASPIGAVILLVMGLVAAIKLLEGNNEELKESFGGMWDSIVWYTDQAILHMRESFFKFARDVLRMLERTVGFAPGISAKIKKARRALLDMERAERKLRMSRKLVRKETELSTKATDEMAKAITNAEEIIAKLVSSQKQEAKVLGANTELLTNNGATAEEVANAKKDFEEGWTATLSREILNRKQLLEVERMNALDQADKLGAERNDIELYYSIERMKIAEDEEREKQRLEKETEDKRAAQLEFTKELTIQSVSDLLSLFSQFYGVQIAHVNKKKQIDIDAVNASVMGEEEKAAAIGVIEAESAAKLKELKRKQAIADKAHAILAIAINTAVAITNAFAQLGVIGGPIAAGVIGAIGVAQAAIVAAQPIPLAKGGLVKRTQGGVNAIIGEGKEDEIVMPLETGVAKLADSLYSKVRDMSFGGMGLPAMAGGGGTVQNHWNIGTLVADDRGIKELERRTRKFRIEEDQRRGLEN